VSGAPSVSIVVPARNAAGDIERLLDALMSLEWPASRLERIVIDDASTDDTAQRIASRSTIKVIHTTRRIGPYAARNLGVKAATGDWIAFTDADCAPRVDWLQKLLAEPIPADSGAIAGEVLALETTTATQRFIESQGLMKHPVTLPHKALPGFSTASVAIRRDVLTRLRGFREDVLYFGDMELSWRMQLEQKARILFRPEAVVLHRHRRTVGALWSQAVQHGRGVAFMKRNFGNVYRISLTEQLGRLGGVASATGRIAAGGDPDRWLTPGFLSLWYAGMLAGYVRGPAWVRTAGPS